MGGKEFEQGCLQRVILLSHEGVVNVFRVGIGGAVDRVAARLGERFQYFFRCVAVVGIGVGFGILNRGVLLTCWGRLGDVDVGHGDTVKEMYNFCINL